MKKILILSSAILLSACATSHHEQQAEFTDIMLPVSCEGHVANENTVKFDTIKVATDGALSYRIESTSDFVLNETIVDLFCVNDGTHNIQTAIIESKKRQ